MNPSLSQIFDEEALKTLKDVYEYWGALSANEKDYASMTDHCHHEYDALSSLIMDLENYLTRREVL